MDHTDRTPPSTAATVAEFDTLAQLAGGASNLLTALSHRRHQLLCTAAPEALRAAGLDAVLIGLEGPDSTREPGPPLTILGTRDRHGWITASDAGISLDRLDSDGREDLRVPGEATLRDLLEAFVDDDTLAESAGGAGRFILLSVHGMYEAEWDAPLGGEAEDLLLPTQPVWLHLRATVDGVLPSARLAVDGSEMPALVVPGTTTTIITWGTCSAPSEHEDAQRAFTATVCAAAESQHASVTTVARNPLSCGVAAAVDDIVDLAGDVVGRTAAAAGARFAVGIPTLDPAAAWLEVGIFATRREALGVAAAFGANSTGHLNLVTEVAAGSDG